MGLHQLTFYPLLNISVLQVFAKGFVLRCYIIHAVMSVAVTTKIQLNGSTRPNSLFEVHPAFRVVQP